MSDVATDLLPAEAPIAEAAPAVVEPAVTPPAEPSWPGAKATPVQLKEYFEKIKAFGADDFKIEVPEGGDAEFAKSAAQAMAEAGLLPQQAQQLAKWHNEQAKAISEKHAQAQKDADAKWVADRAAENARQKEALTNEWGAANFDANMNIAKQAMAQFLPKEKAKDALLALEDALGYGGTMKFMHAIGKGLGEGQLRGANSASGGAQDNSEDARAQRLYNNTPSK